jgi:archaemetzincin
MKICLVPLGSLDAEVFDAVAQAVEDAFGIEVAVHAALPVPEHALNEARGQYLSTAILRSLMPLIPPDASRLLAITDVDLFVPQLNFVFGEAAIDGRVCIISLHRLRPEFYGQQPDKRLFAERAVKEAIHELGHTFGLRHCHDSRCVMSFSNTIEDTDLKSAHFCEDTARKLRPRLISLKPAA